MSVDELVNGRKKWALAFLIFLATAESNELHHGGLLLRRERSDQFGKGFQSSLQLPQAKYTSVVPKSKRPAAEARHPGPLNSENEGQRLAGMENCEADYRSPS